VTAAAIRQLVRELREAAVQFPAATGDVALDKVVLWLVSRSVRDVLSDGTTVVFRFRGEFPSHMLHVVRRAGPLTCVVVGADEEIYRWTSVDKTLVLLVAPFSGEGVRFVAVDYRASVVGVAPSPQGY
jgi:hypothetical protein